LLQELNCYYHRKLGTSQVFYLKFLISFFKRQAYTTLDPALKGFMVKVCAKLKS
jgi:hypothetical protein